MMTIEYVSLVKARYFVFNVVACVAVVGVGSVTTGAGSSSGS
jgi:hypothetical protein